MMAAKATDAHMRATAKWEAANYDKVLVRFPRGTADRIRATGATLNGFTVEAVLDRLRWSETLTRPHSLDNDHDAQPQPDD